MVLNKYNTLPEQVKENKTKIEELEEKITDKSDIETLETKVATNTTDISTLKSEVKTLDTGLEGLGEAVNKNYDTLMNLIPTYQTIQVRISGKDIIEIATISAIETQYLTFGWCAIEEGDIPQLTLFYKIAGDSTYYLWFNGEYIDCEVA